MLTSLLVALLTQSPAPASENVTPTQQPAPLLELTNPEAMHAKGRLSDAEYASLLDDLRESLGAKAKNGTTVVVSSFAMTMYGFIQANAIYDTTQSFTEQMGNGAVARPGTYGGDHDRFQLSARHSRFGFRLKAPEFAGIRASAQFEMDFLGTQLPVGAGQPYFGTEASFVANPTFRARHLFLKVETPYVDILAGQYWPIFGGQPSGNPNTVEIQGIANQLYSRMPQVRLSKTISTEFLNVDLIVGAVRSPQRDAGLPDAQAAVKFLLNKWKGYSTGGGTASGLQSATLTLSGDVRSIRLPEFSASPASSKSAVGGGGAVDLLLPILRATPEHRGNSLTFVGEFVWGTGTADLYSALNGGITFPALPNPDNLSPAPTYTQDIDNGIATYDSSGTLHLIQWTTFLANLQYYLPIADGKVWLSAVYSRGTSANTATYGTARSRKSLDYVSGAIFGDVLPSVRVGLEYGVTFDRAVDDVVAKNHRVNLAVYYLF